MSEIDTWPQYSKLVLEQLRIISEELKVLKGDLNVHRSVSENKITKVEQHIVSIEKDINHMVKLVRDGNGKPPLTLEVELLKSQQKELDIEITNIYKTIDTIQNGIEKKAESDKNETKWKIEKIMAIMAMIISVSGIIVGILF